MAGILQRSFAGGEVGNELLPRADTVKVQSGVRTMLNFWAMRSGGAQNRPGFGFLQECKDAHDDIRIERFHFTDAQAYAMEFGTKYARFYQFAEESGGLLVDGDDGSNPMETQTLYLSNADDDIADITGSIPSDAGSAGFINGDASPEFLSFTTSPGAADTMTLTGASGATRTMIPVHTTGSGNLAAASWVTGDHTLTIELLTTNANTALLLEPKLWRVNSSGATQEGDYSFDSATKPGGAAATISFDAVDMFTDGVGTYTFTWSDLAWTGPFADGDRLALELIFKASANSFTVTFGVGDERSNLVTSVAPQSTPDAIPWASGIQFLVGEVTTIMSLDQYRRVFYLEDTATSPTPTSIASQSGDTHGRLLEKPNSEVSPFPATSDVVNTTPANGATEVQSFITEAGEVDSWTWPTDDVEVGLDYEAEAGAASALNVSVALARFDENNAVAVEGTFTATQDVIAGGSFTFTVTPPSWGTPASTDRFGILIKYAATGGDADIDLNVRDVGSYVDVPAIATGDGSLDYFYSVAEHIDKSPEYLQYHGEFWYPLTGTSEGGNVLLEVPTPYPQTSLEDLDFNQSGRVMTMTHRSHPPYELVRNIHDTQTFGRWTCLPIAFKPRHDAPTSIAQDDTGASGERDIRYKVTAISNDTGAESNPGTVSTTDTGTVDNPESTSDDLSITAVMHGLITGDEIGIISVAAQDSDRSNQVAIEQLEGAIFVVDREDDDTFSLRNTAGILTLPATGNATNYPDVTITFAKAFLEFSSKKIPKGTGARMLSFNWTAVADTREYWIYRTVLSDGSNTGTNDDGAIQDWGFLGSTKNTEFFDSGGEADSTIAVVDEENPPPEFFNPFIYGFWPRASAYHQQRQWFGGSDNETMRLWASKIGDFRNFSRHFPINDDDRGQWDIDTLDASEIQGIRALGQVLVFTSGGIATLKGNSEGVVTPSQPNIEWLASEGSTRVRPEAVDDVLIYVQSRGAYPREVRFDVGAGGFAGYGGRDLTVFAPHLFAGYQISDLSRASVPESILWCARSDGEMLGLTFLKEQDVWAWHRHDTLNGSIQSLTTVPEENEDVVYAVVKRTLTAGTKYYVERMKVRKVGRADTDDRLTSFFMDSGITVDGTNATAITLTLSNGTTYASGETGLTLTASDDLFAGGAADVGLGYRLVGSDGSEAEVEITAAVSTTIATVKLLTDAAVSTRTPNALTTWVAMVRSISGLDHLEGDVVYAVADSNPLGPFTVSSGAITVSASRPYGIIHAGLRITADLELQDVDLVNDKGTDVDRQKRVPRVTAYVQDTRRVQVGPDSSALVQLDQKDDGTATTLTELTTGKITTGIRTSYDKSGRVLFRQSDGLPATVTAVVRHLEDGPGGVSV